MMQIQTGKGRGPVHIGNHKVLEHYTEPGMQPTPLPPGLGQLGREHEAVAVVVLALQK